MKKTTAIILLFALLTSFCFSKQKNDANTDEAVESTDSDWKEQGKKALEETGKFFNSVGETIKDKVDQASEIQCYGTWVHESQNCTTKFKCNKDGTMEITKTVGTETDYWKGNFTATFKFITFTITSSGRRGVFTNKQSDNQPQTWRLTYSLQSEDLLKITSIDIPTDVDGTDFNKGVIFKRR